MMLGLLCVKCLIVYADMKTMVIIAIADICRTRSELNSSQTNLYWTKAVCEKNEIDLNGTYPYATLDCAKNY